MTFEQVKKALSAAARRTGLKDYEIYWESEENLTVETLKDTVSAFSSGNSRGVCFRCIVGGHMGSASGELMTDEALENMVRQAISNAEAIDTDDQPILFSGSPHYEKVTSPEPVLAEPSVLRHLALDLQKATYAQSEKVGDGTQSYMMSAVCEIGLANSTGLSLSERFGMTGGFVSAIVRRGEEARDAFYAMQGSDMEELADLPRTAVSRALDRFGAVPVKSGKYDVVFSGEVFREFLETYSPIFSAKQAQLGLSLLAGKEGSQIASPCVTLIDDPLRAGSPIQTSFDGEGVATSRRAVVENGVLKTLFYDLTTAARAGRESTGNGHRGGYASPVAISPYHFCLAAGTDRQEDLFAAAPDGIYLTKCKGFHAGANAVTGDFSIDSEGFCIRNGKRAEPICGFTIAGNFFDLLKAVERIGDTVLWQVPTGLTCFGSPDLLVRNISVAGE